MAQRAAAPEGDGRIAKNTRGAREATPPWHLSEKGRGGKMPQNIMSW